MNTYVKTNLPWLYDAATGDIVGLKDSDGGETILVKAETLDSTTVLSSLGKILPLTTTVLQSAIPVGIPSSGTVAANGALTTLTTPFLETYGDGVWLFFPANAVYAGSQAGSYWVVMATTSSGTIYDNKLVLPGSDHPPTTPTPIVAAGPGAYVQSTGVSITQRSATVPGGTLGAHGVLSYRSALRHNSSATAKNWRAFLNATVFSSIASTSTTLSNWNTRVYNTGSQSKQISTRWIAPHDTGTTDPVFGTEDTSKDASAEISHYLAADTDWIINLASIITASYGE